MAPTASDDPIDRLYQLPLDEFTSARNALAKGVGPRAAEIKRLEKPNLAAWAVNQLYWRERKLYESLIAASEKLRTAYRQELAGKAADAKNAEAAHRDLVRKATLAAGEILSKSGAVPSDTVMPAIRETLDVLPSANPPGRLTTSLKRIGFEALQGFTVSASPKPLKAKPQPAKGVEKAPPEPPNREREMTRERLRFADAAEREAEAALERTRRAADRADRVVERLEQELAEATTGARSLRKEEATRKAAHEKAAAEREGLAKKLNS